MKNPHRICVMRAIHASICMAVLGLSACANAPKSTDDLHQIDADLRAAQRLAAQTAAGDRERLIDNIDQTGELSFAQRISRIEERITGRPLTHGNQVDLLIDGPVTHAAQLEAIQSARHHVHLEMYIITDESLGQQYAEAMIERARAGVKVRLLYDSVGALGAGLAYMRSLRAAGVQLREYNPINPLRDARLWRFNQRDHRKMLIIDGHTVFTGGINISETYASSPYADSADSLAAESEEAEFLAISESGWRDTHVRISGPAVAQFQTQFIRNWNAINPAIFPVADSVISLLDPVLPPLAPLKSRPQLFPPIEPQGTSRVRMVTSLGANFIDVVTDSSRDFIVSLFKNSDRDDNYAIYKSYLAAMLLAQESIWISQAYFAPNNEFLGVLKQAAERGVDVRLLVPGESDVPLLLQASRYYYAGLMESGVKIYEYNAALIHAKTAVIDGVWATVGSSNLDFRSFVHNDEANAVVIGEAFGEQMREMFEQDLRDAEEVDAEQWAERPLKERIKQRTAALLKYWI